MSHKVSRIPAQFLDNPGVVRALKQEWGGGHGFGYAEAHSSEYSALSYATILKRGARLPIGEGHAGHKVFIIDEQAHNAVAAFDRTLWASGISAAIETTFRLLSRQNAELNLRLEKAESTISELRDAVRTLLLQTSSKIPESERVHDFDAVSSVAQEIATELGWSIERWVTYPEHCLVAFEVKEQNADAIADLMWEFNSRLVNRLPTEVITGVTVDMTVIEDTPTGSDV